MDPERTVPAPDVNAFLQQVFQDLSQPVSALWCALEIAAARPPAEEEDRQDLMAALAHVEELGKRIRRLRAECEERFVTAQQVTESSKV